MISGVLRKNPICFLLLSVMVTTLYFLSLWPKLLISVSPSPQHSFPHHFCILSIPGKFSICSYHCVFSTLNLELPYADLIPSMKLLYPRRSHHSTGVEASIYLSRVDSSNYSSLLASQPNNNM